jgi:hypothetical protein
MTLQELLIDGIEFLESLPFSAENETRLEEWRGHLDGVNVASGTTPSCPKGYYWNGTNCQLDVG